MGLSQDNYKDLQSATHFETQITVHQMRGPTLKQRKSKTVLKTRGSAGHSTLTVPTVLCRGLLEVCLQHGQAKDCSMVLHPQSEHVGPKYLAETEHLPLWPRPCGELCA